MQKKQKTTRINPAKNPPHPSSNITNPASPAKASSMSKTPHISSNPMNLLEFTRQFPDEKACREYLFKTRWNKGFICPRCGSGLFYFHSTRDIYQCKVCLYQSSITAGTIFHKTRTPLQKWFGAIFLISIQKVGISALSLQRILDIGSYRTAWTMCHKIRKAMSDENEKDKNSSELIIPVIPGISGIVEINNTYLGKTKGKQPLSDEKSLLSLNMDIQFTDMKVLPDGFILPTLLQIQNKNQPKINQDNIKFKFISNKNIVYNSKPKKKPNKSATNTQNKNTGGQAHPDPTLHWVSVLVGNLRTNLHGTFHGIGDKHLQRFLDEYCFKFNRRENPQKIFQGLVSVCAISRTITYSELKI